MSQTITKRRRTFRFTPQNKPSQSARRGATPLRGLIQLLCVPLSERLRRLGLLSFLSRPAFIPCISCATSLRLSSKFCRISCITGGRYRLTLPMSCQAGSTSRTSPRAASVSLRCLSLAFVFSFLSSSCAVLAAPSAEHEERRSTIERRDNGRSSAEIFVRHNLTPHLLSFLLFSLNLMYNIYTGPNHWRCWLPLHLCSLALPSSKRCL